MKKTIYLWIVFGFCYIKSQAQEKDTITFIVQGECGMCEERIEKAALIKGVSFADWDMGTKQIKVVFEKSQTNQSKIEKSIAKVGHDTENEKAPHEVYEDLPGCCSYRIEHDGTHQEYKDNHEDTVYIMGKVLESYSKGKEVPVIGGIVSWQETSKATLTGINGDFVIAKTPEEQHLIIQFLGYQNDTIKITDEAKIEVILSNELTLKEFNVIAKQNSTSISLLNPLKIETMGQKELMKAACCNLSESFETNPSVDVAFADAVTGSKQIQMLGLAGPYIQLTNENMPDLRGFSSINGFNLIPGSWIESIQLNKGVGSVVNGYESISGQINIELKKPENSEKLFVNFYGNEGGRVEFNANGRFKLNENISSILLIHASERAMKNDRNKDAFLDNPLSKTYIAHNKWDLATNNGIHAQIGVFGAYQDMIGGQLDFDKTQKSDSLSPWGLTSTIKRLRVFGKAGKVFYKNPGRSIGLQVSQTLHQEKSSFGLNQYNAVQQTFYSNLIYQDIIGTTDHSYKVGVSYTRDEFREGVNILNFDRSENITGVYGEYTFQGIDKVVVLAGFRMDYSSIYNVMITPRLHLKYQVSEKASLRFAGGKGQRTAQIFSENQSLFATSRQIIIKGDSNSALPYGLKQEVAWNYGLNYIQEFKLFNKTGSIGFDFYRTDFKNQIVVDIENIHEILFYNLTGKSYSNSFQAQVDYELIKNLDIRIAYRLYDVKTNYVNEGLKQKQLLAPNRGFINLAYKTNNDWSFDYTLNWIGKKRIPLAIQDSYSPSYLLSNAQISKTWNDKFDLYLGVENLFNFTQKNPIIDAATPYSTDFDSSLIWGPVFGRMIYAGLRFRIV